MKKLSQNTKGFTILELLIATIVFTVILLIASAAMVGLSRQFYKGLNKSKTQEAARMISEEIAKNIQYSKLPPLPILPVDNPSATPAVAIPPGVVQAWCISNTRYAYVEGRQLGTGGGTNVPAVLLRADGCAAPDTPWDRDTHETELIGEGMRLANLEITSDAQQKVYQIRVKVATGSDDQFTDPFGPNAACRNQSGQQFCAVSEFTLIVVRNM